MKGNYFNLTTGERANASESLSFGWVATGDVIDLVSCLLEGAVALLL
jgi:hypothetical protein